MKRRVIQLVLLLVAGAIVNVAVAWGCVIYSVDRLPSSGSYLDAAHKQQSFDRLAQLGWVNRSNPANENIHRSLRKDSFCGLKRLRVIDDPGLVVTPLDIMVPCVELRAGLPCMSFHGAAYVNYLQPFTPTAATSGLLECRTVGAFVGMPNSLWVPSIPGFPYRPLWPGSAINTIFYAAILWVVWFTSGMVRRRIRRRRGVCPACAYPIGTSPVCTECGNQLKVRTCMGLPPPATPATDTERTP